jgi:hypothetical protein
MSSTAAITAAQVGIKLPRSYETSLVLGVHHPIKVRSKMPSNPHDKVTSRHLCPHPRIRYMMTCVAGFQFLESVSSSVIGFKVSVASVNQVRLTEVYDSRHRLIYMRTPIGLVYFIL